VAFLRRDNQLSGSAAYGPKWGVLFTATLFGLLIAVAANHFGPTARALINLPAIILLATAAIVDLQWKVIPDWLTLPGVVWALLASAYLGWPRLSEALVGLALCGGALLLMALISRGGIGGGDVKLVAMIGAMLGWHWGFGVLVFAQLCAAGLALFLFVSGRKGRKDALPFGPFLSAFGVLALLGNPIQ